MHVLSPRRIRPALLALPSRALPPFVLPSLVLCAICTVSTTHAQIPVDYPVVALTEPGVCEDAPGVYSDDAKAHMPGTGIFDVWLYVTIEPQPDVRALSLGIERPADWEILDIEACQGAIEEFQTFGSTVALTIASGASHVPSLRLRVAATSPGRLALVRHPLSGRFSYRLSDGSWRLAWGADEFGDVEGCYAVVGPVGPCERVPLAHPTDWCGLSQHFDSGSIDVPSTVLVTSGEVYVDTLQAYAEECYANPSCGGPVPPGNPCILQPQAEPEWLTFENLDWEPGDIRISMTVDATGVAPGTHQATVTYGGGCGHCERACAGFEVEVGPVPVEAATWGRIKALHRGER